MIKKSPDKYSPEKDTSYHVRDKKDADGYRKYEKEDRGLYSTMKVNYYTLQ